MKKVWYFYLRSRSKDPKQEHPVVTLAIEEAIDEDGSRVYNYGIATCSETDNFSRDIGRAIAKARLKSPCWHMERGNNNCQGGFVHADGDIPAHELVIRDIAEAPTNTFSYEARRLARQALLKMLPKEEAPKEE